MSKVVRNSDGTFTMIKLHRMTDSEFVTVAKEYLMQLEQKAKDSEYFRGRVDGMEYVIDSFEETFKRKESE